MSNAKPARDSESPAKANRSDRAPASLALPVSIAFGSVVVAIGLYAGLKSGRAPDHPASDESSLAPATPSPSAAIASAHAPLAAAPTPPSEQVLDAARRRATEEARAALEGQRATLVAACWAKPAAAKPLPATATFVYAIAFSGEGRELGRAVNEAKIGERPEVAACLRMAVTPLNVAPPGRPFTAKVPITLP